MTPTTTPTPSLVKTSLNYDKRCKSCNGEDHPDHQDAIASEKLKLLKISYLKAEQKQAVVGFPNTDA